MDDTTKNLVEIVIAIIGVVGLFAGGAWALVQFTAARSDYQSAQKWKRAELGKKVLDEMFADEVVVAAMVMLDWERWFDNGDTRHYIKRDDVRAALRTDTLKFSPQAVFIRDSFDSLFDAFARVEHLIDVGLIDFRHVEEPLRYYVEEMTGQKEAGMRDVTKKYLEGYTFTRTLQFLQRFDSWSGGGDHARDPCSEVRDLRPDQDG